MNAKIIGIVGALALAGAAGAFLLNSGTGNKVAASAAVSSAHSSAGKQIIEITAKDGYSPSLIKAKAGIPILLKVKTQDTQDCSTAFTIPSFGIQAGLPATGVTEFDIPAQKAGDTIEGSCQMSMSRFTIEFN
jgi:plastocyanin domain-containing protein